MINVIKVDDFEKFTTKLEEIATAIQNMPTPSGSYTIEKIYDSNGAGAEFNTALTLDNPITDYDEILIRAWSRTDYTTSPNDRMNISIPASLIGSPTAKNVYMGFFKRILYIWADNGNIYNDGLLYDEDYGYTPRIYEIYGIKY